MPPALLMSSIASSAPNFSRMPWRAHGPDSGTSMAIFTSFAAWARARRGAIAAAPVARPSPSAVRRPIVDTFVMVRSPLRSCVGQSQIGTANPVVGEQCLIVAFQHDVAGFQHVATIRQFQRLGDTLFHQQDGDAILAMDLRDALEDGVGDRGCQAHRGFIQHQEARGAGEAAADRQHLLLAAGECAGELAGAFGQDGEQRVDAFQRVVPLGAAGLWVSAHLEIFAYCEGAEHLATLWHVGDAEMGACCGAAGEQVLALKIDGAGDRWNDAADRFEERGFARAIGADDRDELACRRPIATRR